MMASCVASGGVASRRAAPQDSARSDPAATAGPRAAPDHHGVGARGRERGIGVVATIAMSPLTTTGNRDALLDGAHRRPVGAALVELAAGAPVHGDQPHAGRFGAARELRRIDGAIVPAEPHLERDRHRYRADRRLDQRQGMIEIAHQRRARLPAGHLPRRTAHVDVDDRGAGGFGDARALRHPARFAAGELDDVDAAAPALRRAAPRRGGSAASRGARRHFGHDQAGPELGHQAPKRRIGDPRHRRQHRPVRQRHIRRC